MATIVQTHFIVLVFTVASVTKNNNYGDDITFPCMVRTVKTERIKL